MSIISPQPSTSHVPKTRSIWIDVAIGVILLVVCGAASVTINPDKIVGELNYTSTDAITLKHPIPQTTCLKVIEHGTIANKQLKDSKYNELTITHNVKFICPPQFSWKEERAIIEKTVTIK